MAAESLRTRLIMSPPVRAARTAAFLALRPLYRRSFDTAATPESLLVRARRTIPGSVSQIPAEITAFLAYAGAREPERVCEIGTLYGGTTVLLSRVAPSVGLLVGVDLQVENRRFVTGLAPVGQEVHLLEGSSQDEAVRAQVERLCAPGLDLLFVDGGHRYDDVRADFVLYRSLVRPGGLIAFHDIVEDHGTRYGRPTGRWAGGVPRLWREVCDRYPSQSFVDDPGQDGYGIGVIEWDPSVTDPEGWPA